jgi:hypothetical protein
MGYMSLYRNTGGYNNTANGYQSLFFNSTGSNNTSNGCLSLTSNSTGSANTANGVYALYHNSTGNQNTANGDSALYNNTTGSDLSANGYAALSSNTTGSNNTANGVYALFSNSTGTNNTANGYQALYLNTTGIDNTANGYQSLYSNGASSYGNTASGYQSLYANTGGVGNTANGDQSLNGNTTGVLNTATGAETLTSNTTGSDNTADGEGANVNAGSYSNVSLFGSGATGTASNQVRAGNSSVISIGGYASWTNISDGRVKKNIQQNVPGLAFINQLQPITYNLDLDAADRIIQPAVIKDKDGKPIQPTQEELAARTAKEQVVYTGFIAQDVEKIAKSLNYNFSGVDAAKNSKDLYGLRYSDFVAPLVKAVQELSVQNDSLKNANAQQQAINNSLQQQLSDVKNTIAQMQSAMSQCCNSFSSAMQAPVASEKQVTIITDQARLDQNVPNPFNGSSYISYYIPQGFHSAQLMVVDISGNVLKTYTLANSGYGKQVISGSEMAAGMYAYSLLIDGKLIDTKKMVRE